MRQLFAKSILLMLLLVMILSVSLNSQEGYDHLEYFVCLYIEEQIAEFKELMIDMIAMREAGLVRLQVDICPHERLKNVFAEMGVDPPECTEYLLAQIRPPARDERLYKLNEFVQLMMEVRNIQTARGGHDQKLAPLIARWWGPSDFCDMFHITFVNEEYFAVIDLILDFTGITRDELEVSVDSFTEVGPPASFWEGIYIGEDGNPIATNIFDFEEGEFEVWMADRIERANRAEAERAERNEGKNTRFGTE